MNDVRPTSVIFDLDGTLIDSLPGIEFSVKAAFADCGLPYPAVNLRSMIGPPIRSILAQIARTTTPAILDDLERAFRASYDSVGWRQSFTYPGTEKALISLRNAGLRLFIVTNKPRHISMRILEMTEIQKLFESVVTRDSRVPPYADKKEMIASLMISRALDSGDCLVIGDTEEDAAAAAECNVRFVYVSHGYGAIHEESALSVHLRLNSFSQLPQWFGLEFAHDR